jgi:hypothetical protein
MAGGNHQRKGLKRALIICISLRIDQQQPAPGSQHGFSAKTVMLYIPGPDSFRSFNSSAVIYWSNISSGIMICFSF